MNPTDVLVLLRALDTMFELGGDLVAAAKQREPRLNTEPLPPEGDAMWAARERAEEP